MVIGVKTLQLNESRANSSASHSGAFLKFSEPAKAWGRNYEARLPMILNPETIPWFLAHASNISFLSSAIFKEPGHKTGDCS